MRSRKTIFTVAILSVAALLLAGCSSAQAKKQSGDFAPKASSTELTGELTVYAAASLTASFNDLTKQFQKDHPDVTVKPPTYDGSSTLATQLNEGAPADVFASADQANMNKVTATGEVAGTPQLFVSNTLEIAVQPGNPKGIHSLADLAKPGLMVVLCAPEVPCGTASHKLLSLDKVTVTPASEEQNVTAVITKVKLREADAGMVYATDVKAAAGAVDGVTIADADRAVNKYPIAVMKGAPSLKVAKAFVAFVLSAKGQKVLASYGFKKP